jgi:Hypothetical protein (DUF2513)
MDRDMELVRKIMLKIKSGDLRAAVEGYDDDAINFHAALLIDRGLIEGTPHYSSSGTKPADIPDRVKIKRMTWEGHDFIEAVQADTKWNKVKDFLVQAGKDLTIETIKHASKQLFGFG